MRTAFFSAKPFETDALEKADAGGRHDLIFISEQLNCDTVQLAEGCDAVSVFSNDDLSAPVLDLLHRAGITNVTLRSAGYDHVDLAHAARIGIRVANVPEYSPYSIAEHSVMLMLALNRRLLLADRRLRTFDFTLDPLVGFDMNGKVAGIIGTGRIGGVVARILHGFGCRLLGHDVEQNPDLCSDYGLEYVPMDKLLKESDIITVHCPLNGATHHLLNADALAKTKRGVMLINTSRGAVMDTRDVLDALDSGHIGYLGLDVYEHEKGMFFFDRSDRPMEDAMFKRLLAHTNVLVTGHQAFLTETALRNIAETTLHNLDCFAAGDVCVNELSP